MDKSPSWEKEFVVRGYRKTRIWRIEDGVQGKGLDYVSGAIWDLFYNLVTRLARFFLQFVPTFLINFSFRRFGEMRKPFKRFKGCSLGISGALMAMSMQIKMATRRLPFPLCTLSQAFQT